MLVGLFGGTFDPVHRGHIHLAQSVQSALNLHEVRWLLAARPGHRAPPLASIEHRWNMLERVCADHPEFVADDTEIKEPGTSYTFNTVRTLRAAHPERIPCWLLGLDAYATLTEWYRWQELLNYCNLVVVERPEDDSPLPSAVRELEEQSRCTQLQPDQVGQIIHVDIPMLPISATAVRAHLRRGESVAHLVAPAVNSYINQHQLYAEVAA